MNLHNDDASTVLSIAAAWTALIQIIMAILGTYILRRFTTSFSVGFLLGLVIVVAQQNLILSVSFWGSKFGSPGANHAFANFAFGLFVVYAMFAALLGTFQEFIILPMNNPQKSSDVQYDDEDDATM